MNERYTLTATCSGTVIKLECVKDEVFSSGMLGTGFAIVPSEKDFYAPVSGKVNEAHEAGHAYMLTDKNGVEVLVHIGIDTVELEGECFSPVVKSGMSVSQGDKIAYADVERIKDRGFDPVTVVIVTNGEILSKSTIKYGKIKAGDTVFEYTL